MFIIIALAEFGLLTFFLLTIMNRHDRMSMAKQYARSIAIRTLDQEIKDLAQLIEDELDIHRVTR